MTDLDVNPYRPPGVVDDVPSPAGGTGVVIRIEDVRLRAYLALAGMALTLLLGVGMVAGTVWAADWFLQRPAESGLAPLEACVVLHLIASVGYFALLLLWIHRSAHNARLLDGPRSDLSPGLAAGSFFIPFYNLVGPALAMGKVAAVIQRFSHGPATWVGVWWVAWLLSGVMSWMVRTGDATLVSLCIQLGGQGVSLVFSAALVIRLTRQQTWLLFHPPQFAARAAMQPLRAGTPLRRSSSQASAPQPEPQPAVAPHPAAPRPRAPLPPGASGPAAGT